MEQKELIDLAFKAYDNAYAPYSNFRVGACLLCKDGNYFLGSNVENCSFGATNCAERSAIFAAYSNGYRKEDFEAIAIVTKAKTLTSPCGICRQVMVELLNKDCPVILSNIKETKIYTVEDLLPLSFTEEDLG